MSVTQALVLWVKCDIKVDYSHTLAHTHTHAAVKQPGLLEVLLSSCSKVALNLRTVTLTKRTMELNIMGMK